MGLNIGLSNLGKNTNYECSRTGVKKTLEPEWGGNNKQIKNCTNRNFRTCGACATYHAKGKHIQNEDTGTDGGIIQKLTLKKWDGMV